MVNDGDSTLRIPIEAHRHETRPWQQTHRAGVREDRMLREVTVSIPPRIAKYQPTVPALFAARAEEIIGAIARLDSTYGERLSALATLALRAESVASSKIEAIDASIEDFARAAHGSKENRAATSMVASSQALTDLIDHVTHGEPLTIDGILTAHGILMADDFSERHYAGRIRDIQNWIGGSDYSPRNALYVPPPPMVVPEYIADLLAFINRDDVPVLVQAAVAHAQFESIHPFTDGNGRIGRALINAVLRRRGVTRTIVLPLASALIAQRETYFDLLRVASLGDVGPLVRAFVASARIVVAEVEATGMRLTEIPEEWRSSVETTTGRPLRPNTAVARLLALIMAEPFITSEQLMEHLECPSSTAHLAINTLAEAGVLRPLNDRKRDRLWCAGATLDELEDLGDRIALRTSTDHDWLDIKRECHDILTN